MGEGDSDQLGGQSLQLQATGLTLLGVLLGIGVTVGFGVKGDWWLRVLVGLLTFAALLVLARAAAKPGRGTLARIGAWITRGS